MKQLRINRSWPDGLPHLIDADFAIEILRCSRQHFFARVKEGVYRTAKVRAGDPQPKKLIFRPPDLVVDEQRRQLAERH